jgi:hypothetical protein
MDFWTVGESLADRFPELREVVENHILDYWDMNHQPYPHEFLQDYLLPMLASREPEERTKRAYGFLEEVVTNRDEDLVGAAVLSVLEPLVENQAWFTVAREFMGPKTASFASEVNVHHRA